MGLFSGTHFCGRGGIWPDASEELRAGKEVLRRGQGKGRRVEAKGHGARHSHVATRCVKPVYIARRRLRPA